MGCIDLLWNLNVSDNTKYLIILGLIVCSLLFCLLNGKKKKKKKNNNKYYSEEQ